MQYTKHTLPNGLRIVTIPMSNVMSVTLMILVGVGSRYEEKKVNGVTHFLEHMLFKGSKKWPSPVLISNVLDQIGAESNASTSKESTAYYIKARASHLADCFDVLCDMVEHPQLEKRAIENEKTVVLSEIAMYEDTPTRKIGEVFEALLYPNSSLGWDIAGTPESVKGIKQEYFHSLYQKFYYPQNMVVIAAGNVKDTQVRSLTQRYLGGLKTRDAKLIEKKEEFVQGQPQIKLITKKTQQAHIVLGFRGNRRGHKDRWTEEVLSTILGGSKSSRLWVKVREEKGLAYSIDADTVHYQDNGYLSSYAGVAPLKITQVINLIIREIAKLRAGKDLKDQEIVRAKEIIKGRISLGLEDTRSVASYFGSFELLEGKIMTPEEIIESIDKVTKEDILRVARKFFVPERLNLAVIGPYKDSKRFRKLLNLG